MLKPLKIMVDINFGLCSNRLMHTSCNDSMINARRTGECAVAPLTSIGPSPGLPTGLPTGLDLLAPCSLLALLIIGRGAGTG